MDKHFPVASFDAVYLIDLCEPLLDVARTRFARKGWTNVTVLQQDASEFSLPEWANKEAKGSVNFVTLSYSLSMVTALSNRSIRTHLDIKSALINLDPKLLYPARSHRLCPCSRDRHSLRRRLLYVWEATLVARKGYRWN